MMIKNRFSLFVATFLLIGFFFLTLPEKGYSQDYPLCATDFPQSLGGFIAVGEVIFDTDALTFGGNPGGVVVDGVAVFVFDSITVPNGATIVGVGSLPLVLLANGVVQIDGEILLDGQNSIAFTAGPFAGGAGGGAGGVGGVTSIQGMGTGGGQPGTPNSGTGGGGFGGAGGDGGAGSIGTPGAGGITYGNLSIALEGGSGGASGTSNVGGSIAGGGGAGGGVLISSIISITNSATGIISALGGNGEGGPQGASGGGSGGGIVLFAPAVTNNGEVRVDGGDGGPGGCCGSGGGGGGGRILVAGVDAGGGSYSVVGGDTDLFGDDPGEDGDDGVLRFEPTIFPPCIISSVPTLSEWGLIAMAGVLGIVGFMVIRRRKVSA